MKLISVDKDVQSWVPRGQIIAILYKDLAISILPGFLPRFFSSWFYFRIKCMARPSPNHDYEYIGYGFWILPALNGAVGRWPKWYSWAWRFTSWRNYDVCGVIK